MFFSKRIKDEATEIAQKGNKKATIWPLKGHCKATEMLLK